MIKIYGKVSTSEQIIDTSLSPICPEGYIEMRYSRPSSNCIALADGTWQEIEEEATDD